jgi:tetratricopeptide (TPR) repeat protein
LLDGLLLLLLTAIGFLLGCYEMGDSDIWWHLRGGRWILENGRVPRLDPFTFGSADKLWVDIHWSYEVILALAYRAGGVGAVVLLGASVGCAAFVTVVTARRREWPIAATVLCWLPALVLLSFRLDPRPEIFSLLYLGCYLAVLWRADERPALLWLLPLVQVLWTNVQGLFILGPILLGMYATARGIRLSWLRLRGELSDLAEEKRRWKHIGGVAVAVAAACLVNPYFLKGAWFPFDLFPKVADRNNAYKKYIDELQSPADFVSRSTLRLAGSNWFFLALYFLLSLLPLSFLFPATWRATQASPAMPKKPRSATELPAQPRNAAWLLGLGGLVFLLIFRTMTLSGNGWSWLTSLGDNVPTAFVLGGGATAWFLRQRRPSAAIVAGVSGVALAACMVWLDVAILGAGRGFLTELRTPPTPLFAIAAAIALAFVLRWGGDLFRVFLAGAFAYLALQAMQNWSRFALVSGTVLTWNFAEWAAQLRARQQASWKVSAAGWGLRGALACVLGVWLAALADDRFYIHTGEPRHFAFREEPLAFAHDAAIFAGQYGLPDRALVYGLGQTGVYDFHNAPRCKPFMDGRLEMPDPRTFQTYVAIENWLEQGDPRWEKAVADLGEPLVLLSHEGYTGAAEALLLLHADWRCVYFDALATVFVPRRSVSADDFPAVDFAARHFQDPSRPSVPNVPRAAFREEKALYNLADRVPRTASNTWRWRVPLLLSALDRGQRARQEDARQPDVWILLGNCYRELDPEPARPLLPAEAWNVERGLWRAQATYCFRRAVDLQPDRATAWRYLAMSYHERRMVEAELAASEQWLRFDPQIQKRQREQIEAQRRNFIARKHEVASSGPLSASVLQLVHEGRPIGALERMEATGRSSWSWPFAERVAGLYMHLGRPDDARRVWEQARDCPSEALRHCRLASTFWVEQEMDAALHHYRAAREADARLAEASWGLAMLHTQLGRADAALHACTEGLRLMLNAQQRADLKALQTFLVPYAAHP